MNIITVHNNVNNLNAQFRTQMTMTVGTYGLPRCEAPPVAGVLPRRNSAGWQLGESVLRKELVDVTYF